MNIKRSIIFFILLVAVAIAIFFGYAGSITGSVAIDDICTEEETTCTVDSDCDSDQTCVNEKCVACYGEYVVLCINGKWTDTNQKIPGQCGYEEDDGSDDYTDYTDDADTEDEFDPMIIIIIIIILLILAVIGVVVYVLIKKQNKGRNLKSKRLRGRPNPFIKRPLSSRMMKRPLPLLKLKKPIKPLKPTKSSKPIIKPLPIKKTIEKPTTKPPIKSSKKSEIKRYTPPKR